MIRLLAFMTKNKNEEASRTPFYYGQDDLIGETLDILIKEKKQKERREKFKRIFGFFKGA